MQQIPAKEAVRGFSALLDAVLAGARYTITRNGRPIAVIRGVDLKAPEGAEESPTPTTPGAPDAAL